MATISGPRRPDALCGEQALIRLATVDDVDLLVRWHTDPEVARYWDGKAYSREQMLSRLARPDVDAYVIEANGEPVGYIQAWFGSTANMSSLDMFLVPSARGRGVGPDAARALARYLVEQGEVQRITVDPYVWNEAAVRAWMKAGFRAVEERDPDDEHLHPWLLMEFDALHH
jgi:aminoglycoside 6'-N-acetyltransferase